MSNLININLNLIEIIVSIIIFNIVLINFFLRTFKIKKLIDFPNEERKIHKKPIQKIGGLIIFINFVVFFLFQKFSFLELSLFIFVTSIFFIGFFDDLFNLNPYLRILLITTFVCLYLIYNQEFILNKIYFETLDNYKNLNYLNYIFTIFCIVALINAFNLFDGLNGLALSYFIIIFIYITVKFDQNLLIFLVCLCIILLYYNLKNKIFLGDSGVYILSCILGIKLIEINNNDNLYFSSENIFILLILPGVDMMRVFFERIYNKQMFLSPDKRHIHHYFLNKFSGTTTLILLNILSVFSIIIYETSIVPAYAVILFILSSYTCIILYLKKK